LTRKLWLTWAYLIDQILRGSRSSDAHRALITAAPSQHQLARALHKPADWETIIPWPNNTVHIGDYIFFSNTSLFWPTWTDYLYGPTTGLSAGAVSCVAKHIGFTERFSQLNSVFSPSEWSEIVTSTWSSGCESYISPEGCLWPQNARTGGWTTLCDGISRALGGFEMITFPLPGMCKAHFSTSTVGHHTEYLPGPWSSELCRYSGSVCMGISSTYLSLNSVSKSAVSARATSIPRSALSVPTLDCELCWNGQRDCKEWSEFHTSL